MKGSLFSKKMERYNCFLIRVERYRLFSLRVLLEGKKYSVQVQLKDEEEGLILSGEKKGVATFNNLLKLLGESAAQAILPVTYCRWTK